MIPDGLHALLVDYHETVRGLRTGQTGRANACFIQLINKISRLFSQLPDKGQQALPVIDTMLAAKERGDTVALADAIQYQLPAALDGSEVDPTLLDVALISHLRELAALTAAPERIDELIGEISSLYGEYPKLKGLAAFFAGPLVVAKRHADARALLQADHEAGRGSVANAYLFALATAAQGDFSHARSLMEYAYRMHQSPTDGYVRLGWIKAMSGDWLSARELAVEDEQTQRLTPSWRIHLALIHARCGNFDHASTLVARAYADDAGLRDGFARLGWIKAESGDVDRAIDLAERDERDGRLTAPWRINLAQMYGRKKQFAHAEALVHAAYAEQASLKDGLIRLAWKQFQAGDVRGALALGAKEQALGRLAPPGRLMLSQLYAREGRFEDAEALVGSAYAGDDSLVDGFAALGWIRVESGNTADGLALMRRDCDAGRISPAWRHNFDQLLADRQWRP